MTATKIRFSWDLHWSCNYRCPYCWWHGKWDEFKPRNVYPGVEGLLKPWKRIYDRYGEVHVEIAGGEPSTYPGFGEFMSELLKYHTAAVQTNLSGEIDELLEKTPPERLKRLQMGATYHPLFADLDAFIARATKLRKAGMSLGILYLAYPPQVREIPLLKAIFAKHDLFFAVSTFWGTYQGKEYPQSYTEEEVRIINNELGVRQGEKFQTKPLVTQGKLCNAGRTYGIIHPDGEVLRCGGGSRTGQSIIIGNIFDENFTLSDKPEPCPSEHCPCNEWAFLLVKE